jgi:starch synthase
VLTIHNLAYQGVYPGAGPGGWAERLGVDAADLAAGGRLSLLQAGIARADRVTTVSPRYADEIRTEAGGALGPALRARGADLVGILNGADYSVWRPDKDPDIPYHYDVRRLGEKARNKEALLDEMGLDEGLKERPLFGMISRLSAQKGCDLLVQVMEDMVALGAGMVILGSGEEKYQDLLQKAAAENPGAVSLRIGFDESLAHRILAGADILLVPSFYEPCGLTQMYGLKYGTVPLVRSTGGLDDTIVPFNPDTGQGNGFKFGNYTVEALRVAVKEAVRVYQDSSTWQVLMKNGMSEDFSWDRSAQEYIELYESILKR